MPRPKRTKLPPSIPINPVATAARKPLNNIDVSPAVSSSRGTNGSDDSEGIVTKSKTGVNRRGIAPQAVFMSGALALEEDGATRPRPVASRKRVELSRIARDGDYAKASQKLESRKNADLARGRLQKEVQKADIQIQLPTATVAPVQIAKTQATPMRENSVLATENFKRRPRQPSLLQIAQAHHAAVDSEHDGTLDDFNPDDESTPFGKSALNFDVDPPIPASSRHPSSRKRKLSTPDIQVPASQSHSSPAHNSSPPPSIPDDLFDIFVEDSQPDPPLPTIPASRTALPPNPGESDTLAPPQSSSLPPSPQRQALKSKSRTKKAHLGSKPKLKPTNPKIRRQSSPVLPPRSPTPTQSSPTAVPATRSPLKPLTTSTLQNLLPRRRRRVVSSNKGATTMFDIHSSSSETDTLNADEDEDELNYRFPGTKLARNAAATEKKPKRGKPKGATKNKSKDGAGAKIRVPRFGSTTRTTYGRKRVQEDTFGEDEKVGFGSESEDGGSGAVVRVVKMDGKAREEMKRMAAKFREVDDWGLEFEEVTGSSDRMRDAR
ncbi:MAG: hypothetical protein Q9200_004851 [Gallowayella weberi]